MSARKDAAWLAGILVIVWLIAYVFIGIDDGEDRFLSEVGYVSAGVVVTAIVTFFGILRLAVTSESRASIPDQAMRSAIAASAAVTYLVLVGTAGLFSRGEGLPPISQTLLTSFTATVGVIIAFYFGSSAYVAARAQRPVKSAPGPEEEGTKQIG